MDKSIHSGSDPSSLSYFFFLKKKELEIHVI